MIFCWRHGELPRTCARTGTLDRSISVGALSRPNSIGDTRADSIMARSRVRSGAFPPGHRLRIPMHVTTSHSLRLLRQNFGAAGYSVTYFEKERRRKEGGEEEEKKKRKERRRRERKKGPRACFRRCIGFRQGVVKRKNPHESNSSNLITPGNSSLSI